MSIIEEQGMRGRRGGLCTLRDLACEALGDVRHGQVKGWLFEGRNMLDIYEVNTRMYT